MRIITKKQIEDFSKDYPDAKIALEDWHSKTKQAKWDNFSDVKKTFNSVDSVGNGRFVFNVKGNSYRLIALIKFTLKMVYIRLIGTHKEYDKINDCSKE
ncbi:type II toxin-antitoxin system HigB family toxin [Massilibacteroides sp.]|uniref:type II toxin-antitoxin system HigB family toxin n=1 Tax=Massilibacteroides sp. TaxID=2034766 RepID=UPI002622C6C2|nr:type II toxin-antitoxin system HigB family toxin [Massilibacteroides sp.]MDD4514834.1 type II toxin-antitoxin system HigB family toxin [Massilibacteroides sp.]